MPMGSANESTLQALTSRLEAATQTINRLQQDETFIQAMVTEQSQTSSHGDSATGGSSPSALQLQLKDALQQEKELEARYTPDHPDVVASKRRIASLRTEIAHGRPIFEGQSLAERPTKSRTSLARASVNTTRRIRSA